MSGRNPKHPEGAANEVGKPSLFADLAFTEQRVNCSIGGVPPSARSMSGPPSSVRPVFARIFSPTLLTASSTA